MTTNTLLKAIAPAASTGTRYPRAAARSSFITGQHFRQHLVDAHLPGDCLGGLLIIAGEHSDFDAHLVECLDGFHRAIFYRVGDSNRAGNAVI